MHLTESIKYAETRGDLLPKAAANLHAWLDAGFLPPWALSALEELAKHDAWEELNNRFYCHLSLGTGGMRGRTIGARATAAELGEGGEPEHPAVGSACLNDFNIIRATIGLYRYGMNFLADGEAPRLVIAYDVRFFSRHFCELTASTWVRLGGRAYRFAEPRSTPELSFTVRHLRATAGVVITASHNPPHDNGYKIYCSDGGQIALPHSAGVIDAVKRVDISDIKPFLDKDLDHVEILPESVDQAYREALADHVIDAPAFARTTQRVVFTPLHGVGSVIAPTLLQRFGVKVIPVAEQNQQNPRFPTVKLANPESSGALRMGLAKADASQADIVLACDPDADRLGVAARRADGQLTQLTGNQVGVLLAEYRINQLKQRGILPPEGCPQATLLKTFVTTPFLESIAQKHGLTLINTLTGFKWIGAKLQTYEILLKHKYRRKRGRALNYDTLTAGERRDALLRYSRYNVLAMEESYGYLAGDRVRDKDAHIAALLVCELAAHLKNQGQTLHTYLDALYIAYQAYFLESLSTFYFESAHGATQIQTILENYRCQPPRMLASQRVVRCIDFGRHGQTDADGEAIPLQDFFLLELSNGSSYAIRGSGTEPKLKCYFFIRESVPNSKDLPKAKEKASWTLKALVDAVETDARIRLRQTAIG